MPTTLVPCRLMPQNLQHDIVHHQIFPVIMIVLSAGILFVTARGTRQLCVHVSMSPSGSRATGYPGFSQADIASRLIDQPNDSEAGGAVQPVSVLFTDIRGFSSLAENLTPMELSDLLGEFREILAEGDPGTRRRGGQIHW